VNRIALFLAALAAAFAFAVPASAQSLSPGEKAMEVRLAAETPNPEAGGKVTLAVLMEPRPGWHGYWQNPGDAGRAPAIAWQLPPGMTAGPLRYPVPQRLEIGGLVNYVYEGRYALLADLTLPAGLPYGTRLPVRAKFDYLVCTDKVCVPESATVSVDLIVGVGSLTRRGEFDSYREALAEPIGAPGRFERKGGSLRLAIPLPASVALADPYFFPLTDGAIDHSAPQSISRRGDLLIVETRAGKGPAPAALEGVLGLGQGQGLALTARPGPVPAAGEAVTEDRRAASDLPAILLAFAGAILGGVLLNLMPCVFPILSLKALSLAKAGESQRAARREALAYAGGAVLTCAALGAALLALRAGGTAAGWAFQLQEPRIILVLLLLVSAIGLNLAGLFELPALAADERLASGSAFGTGALAAFIATPCTGPFMGAALGAALVLPAAAALAVFAGLGFGLALPFLLLGFVPALRHMLPRPGPWLVWFRRVLAVPMLLTALYLGWVLERQTGLRGLIVMVAALPVLAAALWFAGRRGGWLWFLPAMVPAALAILFLPPRETKVATRTDYALGAEPFSEARLAQLRIGGRRVFVYFTADWCITCKVNEKAVLERPEVARAFAGRGVAVLVGDWSRGDADIARFLEKHGRSGVPLYLWYPAGGEPVILPQILTVGTLAGLP
jgi:thiol:disulfide interchange protein/DsbC/DsbD-like thiol-disulfide interchange protein